MKHLFIIPAHESNECLVDTIQNVVKFNPDIEPYFVLYISDYFDDFDDKQFDAENIIITKHLRRHIKYKYDSQLESLIRAYNIAREKFTDFEYVSIFHTSQLFLRFGYADYIKDYDFSYDESDWRTDGQTVPRYRPMFDQGIFRPLFGDGYLDLRNYCYQMVEKAFYKKELFDAISDACCNKLSINLSQLTELFMHTPAEEIVIPTLAQYFSSEFPRIGANTTLQHIPIYMPYQFSPSQFSIKSVPRDLNHPLRIAARFS